MKKILLLLLITLTFFLALSLYLVDKSYFLCPIEYRTDIIIRNDSRGDGFFAAKRNGNRLHEGLDLFAPLGTPVRAGRLGIVIAAKENKGMGKFVIIKHLHGVSTIYGHLSEIFVSKNQVVRQGQIIGSVGKTGNANHPAIQPHLHFEIRKSGAPQDPTAYLD